MDRIPFARRDRKPRGPSYPGGIAPFGRVWERREVILPDGSRVMGYYESGRGMRLYFEVEGRWYSIPIFSTQGPSVSMDGTDLRTWEAAVTHCKKRVSAPEEHGPGKPFLYLSGRCRRRARASGYCWQHEPREQD